MSLTVRKTPNAVPFSRVTILAQMILAAIVIYYVASSIGVQLPFVNHGYELQAYVPDADGLNPANRPQVMVAGVPEGTVVSVTYSRSHRQALVRVQLDGSVRGKLFANASLRIFPRGVLNNLVVDITPGTPSAGPLHGDMIEHAAPAPIGYDQVLADLNASDRAYAQILIGTLAQMLRKRPGPLRDAIDQLPSTVTDVNAVAAQLAARRTSLTTLVGQLDTIVTATGQRGTQLTDALRLARRTLAVTAARQGAIEHTIAALPSTLNDATAAFGSVERLAQPLNPTLNTLRSVAAQLPAAVRSVRTLLPTLHATITSLGTLAHQGTRPLQILGGTLSVLTPTASSLNRSQVVPLLGRTVNSVVQNEGNIGDIMRFWPSTFSTQNSVAPLTRTAILNVVPVDPQMLGLPSFSTSTPAAAMIRAANRLKSLHPNLFNVPARFSSEPLAVIALAALIGERCQARQAGACAVLATLFAHPPNVLGPS